MKIGIIREEKFPFDKRVALTPWQCQEIVNKYKTVDLVVMSSQHRCYSDHMYSSLGIQVVDNLENCDILIGIKEVPVGFLISNKTYIFFSHTIKAQKYNMGLLLKMINMNIRMIDYEILKDQNGKRLIGFGRYAGVVGAYNAFLCHGLKREIFKLRPAYLCNDRFDMEKELNKVKLNREKIIVSGKGRVGRGILEIIKLLGIKEVSKHDFIYKKYDEPVYVHLDFLDYYERLDGEKSSRNDFYNNTQNYKSVFMRFANVGDIFIAGHYYSQGSPYLFTKEDAKDNKFNLSVIADISCDINGPVASTIRSSKISEPIYGYNPDSEKEDDFMKEGIIAVMAVDNLPCELPKDASDDFGTEFINNIMPLLVNGNSKTIKDATICENGKLNSDFLYLKDFIGLD